MALNYYDDAIVHKLKKWLPDKTNLRVLSPDETDRVFKLVANDSNDAPIKLPLIALSRDTDIELLATTKQSRSFDGLHLASSDKETIQLNVLPVKMNYQLDIICKTADESDEYLRNYLFKIINNPALNIEIPYNSDVFDKKDETRLKHIANIQVQSTVSDTSAIEQRMFPGEFHRWTIQFELQDAFLFSIPYRKNWYIDGESIELSSDVRSEGELEWTKLPKK